MIFTKQATSAFLLTAAAATLASSSASAQNDILWTGTGGGWRAMVAQSAYAQIFSNLGILAGQDDTIPQIKVVAAASGSAWFFTQFAFSENYYNAVVNGNATSLGQFTQAWMDAYATTQSNIPPTCGILQSLCDMGASSGPALAEVATLLPLAMAYNESWPEIVYAMFNATSNMAYNDPNMVNVKASSTDKLSQLSGVDVCFHTSLLPNARARDANTITYLANDYTNVSSSYTVPIAYDYCVGDTETKWLPDSWPGGNVYNLDKNVSFANSNVVGGFPMFPPNDSDGSYVTPQHDEGSDDTIVSLSPKEMSPPFGDDPTVIQISTASSSTVGYMSEEAASYFAQYFSITEYGIQHSTSLTEVQRVELKTAVDQLQDLLWSTGLLANAATMSGWIQANPATMPPATESNYWFTDGGYTDGPSAAHAIARYQQLYGTSTHIKLIISNQNYYTDNNNNILYYFNYQNDGTDPGDFIWPMGVGEGPQTNPQMSKQIFGEEMTAEELSGLFETVTGTNLTMAVLPLATTVDNGKCVVRNHNIIPRYLLNTTTDYLFSLLLYYTHIQMIMTEPFGVKAGQQVSIAVINLNSNIPTFVIGEKVIEAETPGLVSLAEAIASSQDLANKVSAFVGITTMTPTTTPATGSSLPSSSANNVVGSTKVTIFSWVVALLGLPLVIV
jgi:hypothetical protein